MTNEVRIEAFEEIMELEEGTLNENCVLDDFEEWDSMTKLSIIAESKKIFGKDISGSDLKACSTVSDLLKL